MSLGEVMKCVGDTRQVASPFLAKDTLEGHTTLPLIRIQHMAPSILT